MSSRLEHDPFAPPRDNRRLRSWVLALLAHAVLVGALVWKVSPPEAVEPAAIEAELWSDTFVQAAPRAVPVPAPQPEPEPAPEPEPEPAPEPIPLPPPPPPAPPKPSQQELQAQRDAEIALQERKKKEAEEKQRELEAQ